jgi:hypothetical protein
MVREAVAELLGLRRQPPLYSQRWLCHTGYHPEENLFELVRAAREFR